MSVKLFLSAVSDEFRAYRDQLDRDLTRHNVEVKVQEQFKEYGNITLEKLDLYIKTCNAVVHLVGDMVGAEASPASTASILLRYPDIAEKLSPLRELLQSGRGISYTQWEAWLALYHGKALLIAKADQLAPRGSNYAPTDASHDAQEAHLERLRTIERYPIIFSSPDNLAKQILSSTVLDLLVAEQRKRVASTQYRPPYSTMIAVLLLLLLLPLAADQLTKAIGLTLAAPVSIMSAAGGLALALLYWRYLDILGSGGEPPETLERQAYDALRESLASGGLPAKLYSHWLASFLDAIDRFFGDASLARRTLFPHAFGLRTPVPLWTAQSFDYCLLISLVYPIVTICIIWGVSGHVGPAEAVLGLKTNLTGLERGLATSLIGVAILSLRQVSVPPMVLTRWHHPFSLKSNLWILLCFLASLGGALVGAGPLIVGIALALAFVDVIPGLVAVAVVVAGAVTIPVYAGGRSSGNDGLDPSAFIQGLIALFVAFGVDWFSKDPVRRPRGMFFAISVTLLIVACFGLATYLAHQNEWKLSGPFLLFLGLLTLLNAPFGWFSLGLTRALLRRGLELKGWWPFFLALIDAILAGVIVTILALTMVVGAQSFDWTAVQGGGNRVLPMDQLLDGIASHPEAPEFWWIYALLILTAVPSLINLAIGSTALMRTLPGLPFVLLRFVPNGSAVANHDRAWVALVLTLQIACGVALALVVQALAIVSLISYVMPWFGGNLLQLVRHVCCF